MSFNWRLLLAPAEILDYVVEHEVAHLDVQDHSHRFWRLLRLTLPRLARARGVAASATVKRFASLLPAEDPHGQE